MPLLRLSVSSPDFSVAILIVSIAVLLWLLFFLMRLKLLPILPPAKSGAGRSYFISSNSSLRLLADIHLGECSISLRAPAWPPGAGCCFLAE